MAGNRIMPDVLAEVCGVEPATVALLVDEGVHAGTAPSPNDSERADTNRLAHDLFRETVIAGLAVPQRLALHQRIADALEHRHARGGAVVPADLARHMRRRGHAGRGHRAITWARAAADVERARLAFGEAAAHLARARRAIEDFGEPRPAPRWSTCSSRRPTPARAGDPPAARALLDDAWNRAAALDDAERLGQVALGVQRLGARFAMPRNAVVEMLETARAALDGTGTALEAQLTASLARELHHSIPAHRPRARPLSERAIALARALDDPQTLAACLLARHDVLWTPGRAAERIDLAREIAELARPCR